MGRRTRGYGAGKWGLVGGKCERFESPGAAIEREVLEEIKIACDMRFYREIVDIEFDPVAPWLVTLFIGTPKPGQIYCPDTREIDAIAFVNSESLGQFDFAFPKEKQILEKYFGLSS